MPEGSATGRSAIFLIHLIQTQNTMKTYPIIAITLTSLLLASCTEEEAKTEVVETAAAVESQLSGVFLTEEPTGAITVSEARENAKPGEMVVIKGKIAGVMNPFTTGYASVVLANEALKTCDLIPGDECETPWDACCVAPEDIKSQRMTIQVLGEDGLPVAEDLKGVNELSELDVLVVTGVVNESSTEENLVLDLNGIYQL